MWSTACTTWLTARTPTTISPASPPARPARSSSSSRPQGSATDPLYCIPARGRNQPRTQALRPGFCHAAPFRPPFRLGCTKRTNSGFASSRRGGFSAASEGPPPLHTHLLKGYFSHAKPPLEGRWQGEALTEGWDSRGFQTGKGSVQTNFSCQTSGGKVCWEA